MSSFATTSGSGPFKALLLPDDSSYESSLEFDNEEKALMFAEVVFHIICEDERHTLEKYKFENVDK